MTEAIKLYDKEEAALALLEETYKDAQYDVTTTEGMTHARKARRDLVMIRTDTDKAYKEGSAPHNKFLKDARDKRDEIKGRVKALEDPIDTQIKAEEERKAEEKRKKEEAERQRIAIITETIQVQIVELPIRHITSTSAEIKEAMDLLSGTELDDTIFEEYIGDAHQAQATAVEKLNRLYEQALANEKAEAEERAKAEERKKAQEAEDERLQEERDLLAKQKEEFLEREAERKRKQEEHDAKIMAEQEEIDRKRAEQKAEDDRIQAEKDEIARREKELESQDEIQDAEEQAELSVDVDYVVQELQEVLDYANKQKKCQARDAIIDFITLKLEARHVTTANTE